MKNIIGCFLLCIASLFSYAADILHPEVFKEISQKLSPEERESIYLFFSYIAELPSDKKEEVQEQMEFFLKDASSRSSARILSVISRQKPEDSLQLVETLFLATNIGWFFNEDMTEIELLGTLNKMGLSIKEKEYFAHTVNTVKRNKKEKRSVVRFIFAAGGMASLSLYSTVHISLVLSFSPEELHHCIQYGVKNCIEGLGQSSSPVLY